MCYICDCALWRNGSLPNNILIISIHVDKTIYEPIHADFNEIPKSIFYISFILKENNDIFENYKHFFWFTLNIIKNKL